MEQFTEDQYDALREISNLAMGEAGVNLSKVLDAHIELSIPEIRLIDVDTIIETLAELTADVGNLVSIARLGFQGSMEGESLLIYGERALRTVSELLGDGENPEANEGMHLRDISNILAIACLNGVASRLGGDVLATPVSVYSQRMPARDTFEVMFAKTKLHWRHTLLTKITFQVKETDFRCVLLIFLSESSINKLGATLNKLLG